MFGSIDWSSVHVAGAFILGAIFGTVAVIRILHALVKFFEHEDRRRKQDGQ